MARPNNVSIGDGSRVPMSPLSVARFWGEPTGRHPLALRASDGERFASSLSFHRVNRPHCIAAHHIPFAPVSSTAEALRRPAVSFSPFGLPGGGRPFFAFLSQTATARPISSETADPMPKCIVSATKTSRMSRRDGQTPQNERRYTTAAPVIDRHRPPWPLPSVEPAIQDGPLETVRVGNLAGQVGRKRSRVRLHCISLAC